MTRVLRVAAGLAAGVFLLAAGIIFLPVLLYAAPSDTYPVLPDTYFVFDWISALLYLTFAGVLVLILLALAQIIDMLEGNRA